MTATAVTTTTALALTADIRTAFLEHVGEKSRGIVERAFAGKASPRQAIKAKCLECSGFDRAEVAACSVVLCPLHPYRPFQNARKPAGSARGSEVGPETGAAGTGGSPESPRVPWGTR
jgi:hypothetical protein